MLKWIIPIILTSCATQYIPNKVINVPCTPPPECPPLYIIQENNITYGLLKRKEQYLICKVGVDTFLKCLIKREDINVTK